MDRSSSDFNGTGIMKPPSTVTNDDERTQRRDDAGMRHHDPLHAAVVQDYRGRGGTSRGRT
jgi:hypothetical protein